MWASGITDQSLNAETFFPSFLVSHMVIEEVNFMQNHLEIEKTCRESAEALATKVRLFKEGNST